jgi:NIMA (never in mitosis gene a)-related kinase
VKISDLNVSKLDDGLSYTRTGTLTYASPEVWKGERYDSKCDIWSFGCLLYEIICLRKPFECQTIEELSRRITKGQYDKIVAEGYSKDLKDLPTYMLHPNPKLRPSAATLCKLAKNRAVWP